LNVHLEFLLKFHYQDLWVCVASIGDQGLEAVQVVAYYLISLVVGHFLQCIYSIGLYIDWKELSLEVLVKVYLGLQRKHANIQFLLKEILGLFYSPTSFEKY